MRNESTKFVFLRRRYLHYGERVFVPSVAILLVSFISPSQYLIMGLPLDIYCSKYVREALFLLLHIAGSCFSGWKLPNISSVMFGQIFIVSNNSKSFS